MIEVLLGLLVIVLATLGTFTYFSVGLGSINKQGNRRAALERARQRLDQLMATNAAAVTPLVPDAMYELFCAGDPCVWTRSATPVTEESLTGQPVTVDELASRVATTVRWIDDPETPDPNPSNPTPDALEFAVRVWFYPNFSPASANGFTRVYLKTLRVP